MLQKSIQTVKWNWILLACKFCPSNINCLVHFFSKHYITIILHLHYSEILHEIPSPITVTPNYA